MADSIIGTILFMLAAWIHLTMTVSNLHKPRWFAYYGVWFVVSVLFLSKYIWRLQ